MKYFEQIKFEHFFAKSCRMQFSPRCDAAALCTRNLKIFPFHSTFLPTSPKLLSISLSFTDRPIQTPHYCSLVLFMGTIHSPKTVLPNLIQPSRIVLHIKTSLFNTTPGLAGGLLSASQPLVVGGQDWSAASDESGFDWLNVDRILTL